MLGADLLILRRQVALITHHFEPRKYFKFSEKRLTARVLD
jgi:hypothetical protein